MNKLIFHKINLVPIYFALMVLIYVPFCSGQSDVLDNLTIFSNLIQAAITKSFDGIELKPNCVILLRGPQNRQQTSWLFEKEFYHFIKRKGIERFYIATNSSAYSSANDECGYTVTYSPLVLKVTYESVNRPKNGSMLRNVDLKVHSQIMDKTSKLVFSEILNEQYSDSVDSKLLPALENSNYLFTQGNRFRTSGNFLSKYLEPLASITTMGAIIYMFYSFRSK